jgi:predicted RNA polymerase sigma factor
MPGSRRGSTRRAGSSRSTGRTAACGTPGRSPRACASCSPRSPRTRRNAALHDEAPSAEETDWPQILAWYDDLVALTEDPVRQDPAAVLGRAVAVGHVLGPAAGLRETERLRDVIGERHRWHAVRGHLHELDGDLPAAATAYAEAARRATNVAERDHLVRQAARARAARARPARGPARGN